MESYISLRLGTTYLKTSF